MVDVESLLVVPDEDTQMPFTSVNIDFMCRIYYKLLLCVNCANILYMIDSSSIMQVSCTASTKRSINMHHLFYHTSLT